ncbi:MAG: alpha/beta fold hydrolase [Actinomycetota bacterium]
MESYLADHVTRVGAGNGEPLLLIHGLGHCKEAWDPVIGLLGARFDVAAIDLPGFGGAPALEETPDDHSLSAFCEQVMDGLGWDRAHVAGNSLGGLIAIRMASRGRALSATALSPGGMIRGWEKPWARGMLRVAKHVPSRLLPLGVFSDTVLGRKALLGLMFGKPGRMTPSYARSAMAAPARATAFEETLDAVDEIDHLPPPSVPVTIAWGSRDMLLFPWQGQRWKAALPDARLVTLRGLGHVPMPDDPGLVTDVITRTTELAQDTAST